MRTSKDIVKKIENRIKQIQKEMAYTIGDGIVSGDDIASAELKNLLKWIKK
jgi:hypothetical protein